MESIEFLNYEFLGNSLEDYFYFIVAFVLGAILIIPVKAFISKVLIKYGIWCISQPLSPSKIIGLVVVLTAGITRGNVKTKHAWT